MTIVDDDPRLPYEQLADDLRGQIQREEIAPGGKLPSVRDLARHYRVSPTTVQKGLGILRDAGWIVTSGRGSYARDPRSAPPASNQTLQQELERLRSQITDLSDRVRSIEETLANRADT
ncbi:GntR family transcriptional regulator [Streptomyces sp. JJ38]|uniref:GntR family transcriptional regulator n=1 Tax=Streptomyces sp. JJ38 TaxID=2738128 RepID=UPI001C57254A|nr:GntR family transcriptional regulator [Streptomyces sp. JJ38]MBW1597926.1 GntR family transcriptional regulator [Streptomyces sp. JJ38]